MTTIKKMLISFTAGAILGILYAPAKGAKTRQKLADVGSDIKDGWNSIIDRVTNKDHNMNNLSDRAVEEVESVQFTVDDRAGYL